MIKHQILTIMLLVGLSVMCVAENTKPLNHLTEFGLKYPPRVPYDKDAVRDFLYIKNNPEAKDIEQRKTNLYERSQKTWKNRVSIIDVWAYPMEFIWNDNMSSDAAYEEDRIAQIISEKGFTNFIVHVSYKPIEKVADLFGLDIMIRTKNKSILFSYFRDWNFWVPYNIDNYSEISPTYCPEHILLFSVPTSDINNAVLYAYGKSYLLKDILIP